MSGKSLFRLGPSRAGAAKRRTGTCRALLGGGSRGALLSQGPAPKGPGVEQVELDRGSLAKPLACRDGKGWSRRTARSAIAAWCLGRARLFLGGRVPTWAFDVSSRASCLLSSPRLPRFPSPFVFLARLFSAQHAEAWMGGAR